MLELFIGECRRFRLWALGAGLLHTGTLLFFDFMVDPLQQPQSVYQLAAAIYAVGGALLGLYQAGGYARINAWIMLLHRPLAPRAILAAVAGAGATMLALAVVAPILIMLAAHDLTGARFVDARHWLLPIAGLLVALIGYLAGLYAALSPRRYGWLALIPALLPTVSGAAGAAALVVQALTALWLVLMVLAVFKPDLQTPPGRASGLAMTALATAMGVYVLAVAAGGLAFETASMIIGNHPRGGAASANGVVAATRIEGGALIEAGLAGRRDDQARVWREQVRLSEVFAIPPTRPALPVRGAMTNMAPMEFDDPERGVRWTFSHDDMRFHGVRLADRRKAGVLGVEGDRPFRAPPLVSDSGMMIARDGVFTFDADSGVIRQRIHLAEGEVAAAPPAVIGEAVGLLTSRALRFYDRRVLEEDDRRRPMFASVPLAAPVGNVMRIDLIELMEGYLVSVTYARGAVEGPGRAWQDIVEIDGSGRARQAARRALTSDYPLAARFMAWWISPGLSALRDASVRVLAAEAPLAERLPIRIPAAMMLLAGALSLVAAAITAWLGRRRRLAAASVGVWTLAALLAGLPMLVAFWLIRPTPRR